MEDELKKGDIVEVSTCHIINDVGGSTFIRNNCYKEEYYSFEKLIDLPIEVEVIKGWYDYETGYNYIGKIKNKDLLKEVRKIGITGYKADDYKKYNNKELYETALEASKNYNPSIVYFSGFDVVKLCKNNEKGIEI